ncbi:MAG: putative transporter ATPase and permease protein [Acidimicrobiales bacterium]|jgi:ABC-type branched-subunit amino acid transport system permease subunit|nr:putative transporter ATPase and permease protein [Acidimicrobiales bacterium]
MVAFSIPAWTVVAGLVNGLGYGLLALGLVLIYRSNRVLNFAHGQLGVTSAVLLSKLVVDLGINYWPALVFVLIVAAVIGAGTELILRRLFDRPRLLVMVATIGLSQVLFLLTLAPFIRPKTAASAYPLPFHSGFTIGNGLAAHHFTGADVLTLIVAPLAALALAVFFARSPHGLAMRAMAENADSARLAGVWVRRTSTLAWVIAALLSAVTAILAAPAKGNGFVEVLGPDLLLRALAAALIGAMTSLPIAFAAGIGIGVFEQVMAWNVHSDPALQTIMFAVLIAALLVRVRGLRTGARDEERSSWRFGVAGRMAGAGGVEALRRQVGWAGVALAIGAAAVLPALVSQGRAFLLSRIFVFAVIAVSITVLTGWAGQLSLGHFGLVAVGAIVASRLAPHWPLPLVLMVAGLMSAAVAILVGLPALRIKGLYLAVSTLAFALLMQTAVLNTPCWKSPLFGFHACTGLPDPASQYIARPSIFGISLVSERAFAWFALAVLVVVLGIVRVWRDHGLARAFVAVRENEIGAAAMGIRVARTKLLAFALSGFLAGVAGVCFALVTQRFKADAFSASQSILVVSMVIIGGLGSVQGAVLGAVYLIGLPAAFGSGVTTQFATSGIGLLVFILYLPGGLAAVLTKLGDAVTGFLASPSEDVLPAADIVEVVTS